MQDAYGFEYITDIPCIIAHKNFDAVCLNQDFLWAALVILHDRESSGPPNRNQFTNRQVNMQNATSCFNSTIFQRVILCFLLHYIYLTAVVTKVTSY